MRRSISFRHTDKRRSLTSTFFLVDASALDSLHAGAQSRCGRCLHVHSRTRARARPAPPLPGQTALLSGRVASKERWKRIPLSSFPERCERARGCFVRACARTCGGELKLRRPKVARRVYCEPRQRPTSDANFPPEAASIDGVRSSLSVRRQHSTCWTRWNRAWPPRGRWPASSRSPVRWSGPGGTLSRVSDVRRRAEPHFNGAFAGRLFHLKRNIVALYLLSVTFRNDGQDAGDRKSVV